MGIGQKIANIGSRALLFGALIAGPAYAVYHNFHNISNGSIFKRASIHALPDSTEQRFAAFETDFVDTTIPGFSVLKGTVSYGHGIPSEAQAFLMLLAHAHNDKDLVTSSTKALLSIQESSGSGLTPWRYALVGKSLSVKDDFSRNSALDADCDSTMAMIWSYEKNLGLVSARKIQQLLGLIWPAMNFHGDSAIPGPSEDWGNGNRVLHPASYFLVSAFERFAGYDNNDQHDWIAVANYMMDIREKLFETSGYTTNPDFIYISYANGQYYFTPTNNTTFRSTMGFDGVRTFLRIGMDAVMVRDTALRNRNIVLARKILDKLGNTPQEIESAIAQMKIVYGADKGTDGVITNKETAAKELLLAAYTALAYGAKNSTGETDSEKGRYQTVYLHLSKLLAGVNEAEIKNKYYDRTVIQIALALIGGGFESQPNAPLYSHGKSRQLQALCMEQPSWYLERFEQSALFIENFGNWNDSDSLARATLNAKKALDWLQDCGGPTSKDFGLPRQESNATVMEFRYFTSQNLNRVLQFQAAVWELQEILKQMDTSNELTEKALSVLDYSLKQAGYLDRQVVQVYEELLRQNPNNEYIKLALANAQANIYELGYVRAALENAGKVVASSPKNIRAQIVLSNINYILAQLEIKNNEPDSANNHLAAAEKAANEAKRLAVASQNKDLLRQSLFALANIYQEKDEYNNAIAVYKEIIPLAKNASQEQINATLGMSSCYRESSVKDLEAALGAIKNQINIVDNDYTQKENPMLKFMDAGYLQLLSEKIRIIREKEPPATTEKEIIKILSAIPQGGIRTNFERIIYYLDQGLVFNAKKEAEVLQALKQDLSLANGNAAAFDAKILPDSEISVLNNIENFVKHVLLPKASADPNLLPKFKGLLLSMINDLTIAEIRTRLTDLAQSDLFEMLAEEAAKIQSINGFLVTYKGLVQDKSDINLNKRLAILDISSKIILAINNNNYEEARSLAQKAAVLCRTELKEESINMKTAEALFELYRTISWYLRAQDSTQFIALNDELVGRKYLTLTDKPFLSSVLESLRERGVREAINALISSRPDLKRVVLQTSGEAADSAQDSLRFYRAEVGLDEVAPVEFSQEIAEYKEILDNNELAPILTGYILPTINKIGPEKAGLIYKELGIEKPLE